MQLKPTKFKPIIIFRYIDKKDKLAAFPYFTVSIFR